MKINISVSPATQSWLLRTGSLALAFLLALVAENLAIGVGYRQLFLGAWEMGRAGLYASPIVWVLLLPLALALAAWSVWHDRAPRTARWLLALLIGAATGLALAVAPTGRTFANPALRAGLGAGAGIAAFAIWALILRVGAQLHRRHRAVVAGLGVLAAVGFWCVDALLFARLYPSLHLLAGVLSVLSVAVAAVGLTAVPKTLSYLTLALVSLCTAWVVPAARHLHGADNLRLILLEHAPWLGRGITVASKIAPVPLTPAIATELTHAETGRRLHWNDQSVLLITVDALRADHVSTYGYPRKTTPVIDEIAEQSTLFEYAYCATPHTSYSVSSLMTGKYMHPLLSMGLGGDSETWADMLRHYGYRTAAFYPPPVFFVDQDRFTHFRDSHLGFEYAKVEFATSDVRVEQVRTYLDHAPEGVPLFLWVHLFDPHEPYVFHQEFPFGTGLTPTPMDAYDSEIALADQTVGRIVEMFNAKRPEHVLMISADHGEEFGEHGGLYHGSSAYEEQVRVPLIVRGKGVTPGRVPTPVQLIDLMPTFLSALGTPRPPRLRGRDLGPMLAGDKASLPEDEGFAFAEVVPLAMVARGTDRLVCRRAENACALYDIKSDPQQQRDIGALNAERVRQLRGIWQRTELDHGRLEGERGAKVPPALRRGLQGDRGAAVEVAALLSDPDVMVRRAAARVLAELRAEETVPQLEAVLASEQESDAEVRGLVAVALTRLLQRVHPDVEHFASWSPSRSSKRLAAVALAELGDASRLEILLDALSQEGSDVDSASGDAADELPGTELDEAELVEIVNALVALRARGGGDAKTITHALVQRLDDVRLRPHLAWALGKVGDSSARAVLLELFQEERNRAARPPMAKALLALRAAGDRSFERSLVRFAGMPEPIEDAMDLARAAYLLGRSGGDFPAGRASWSGTVRVPTEAEGLRVFVELAAPAGLEERCRMALSASVQDQALTTWQTHSEPNAPLVMFADVAATPGNAKVKVAIAAPDAGALRAVWVVPVEAELPPPPPEPFDAGVSDSEDAGKP